MSRLLFPFFFLLLLLYSCRREPRDYTKFTPVLLKRESLESSVTFHAPEKITEPAKIYYKDNFIFISERFKGVHVIDNTDPKNPVNTGYISVPGCIDMAIHGNTLYADNAVDLVAVDLNSVGSSSLKVTKRIKEVFPELNPPDGKELPEKYAKENRPENTVLVAWKQ